MQVAEATGMSFANNRRAAAVEDRSLGMVFNVKTRAH